jgi:DNA-binding transcriptional MerR regulator
MRIGEVARATGVSTKTLRFYEAEGLLPEPNRTASGYRDYHPDVVGRVTFVRQAQSAGLTLAQIGEVLAIRDGGQPPCEHVAALVEQRLDEVNRRLAELERTRRDLLALRHRLDDLDPSECRDGDICVAISAAG